MRDVVYSVEDSSFKKSILEGCAKVDGHVHSMYSKNLIQTPITKIIGVKESYNKPRKMKKILEKRGMNFFTVSDHDSILGAIEMRRYFPEESFINCEYTVNIEPNHNGQVVHVGCWGIDYAGSRSPRSDLEVFELHDELMQMRHKGCAAFAGYCKENDIAFALNHPAWESTPKSFTGKQLDELTDIFPVIEINGDFQLENLVAIEISVDKNKPICAGTDAHTYNRMGNQYTCSTVPAKTPYEFIDAFKKGKIGIGSRFSRQTQDTIADSFDAVKKEFNCEANDMQKDIYQGILNYFVHEWGKRKLAAVGVMLSLPVLLSNVIFPEIGIPAAALLEGSFFATIPVVMSWAEKIKLERRTRKLFNDYHEYKFMKATEQMRDELEDIQSKIDTMKRRYSGSLPSVVMYPAGWQRFVYNTLNKFRLFHSDYDLSDVLKMQPVKAVVEKQNP